MRKLVVCAAVVAAYALAMACAYLWARHNEIAFLGHLRSAL